MSRTMNLKKFRYKVSVNRVIDKRGRREYLAVAIRALEKQTSLNIINLKITGHTRNVCQ